MGCEIQAKPGKLRVMVKIHAGLIRDSKSFSV